MFKHVHSELHRRRGGHDDGPGFGAVMRHGGGPFGRGRFGGGWGPRARRGEAKFLVLEILTEAPRHGYEIIGAIEAKRGFRPSPGSIYPTLQMLEEGGFVTGADSDGKRVYTITDGGRRLLAERSDEGASEDDDGRHDARHALRSSVTKLGAAVFGARDSDDATLAKIRTIVDRARREIYAILASDE